MYKTIKIDETTHRALKMLAYHNNISIKEYIERIVNRKFFDVEACSTDWLEAVNNDIEIELKKRKNKKD